MIVQSAVTNTGTMEGVGAGALTLQNATVSGAGSVLALAGERDRVHPPATVAQIAERYGGTTLVMDGMSHWLVGEPGWKRVAEAVLGWLAAEGAL